MSVSTAEKVYLCVGLIGFAGVFVYLGCAMHLVYTKMELMLGHLKNCPAVMIRAPFKNGGPWGKMFVLVGIMAVIIAPRLYLLDGGASSEDLKNFPARLKRKMIVMHWCGVSCLLILVGLWAVDALGLV